MHFLLEWCVTQIKKLLGLTDDAFVSIALLRDQIASFTRGGIQSGVGSPEGLVNSADGQWYFDVSALPTGQVMYFNLNTSSTTGWVNAFQIT